MSTEITDVWGALRAQSQLKRSQNRIGGAELLRSARIKFESCNMGAHLVILRGEDSEPIIDFWPGTGKWTVRTSSQVQKNPRRSRGAKSLISFCLSNNYQVKPNGSR